MTRVARVAVAALVAVVAVAALTVAPARADSSRAVVIVDTGEGTVTRVIAFSGTISGYDALVLAGASPQTYGFAGVGAAICRLFGVGNDPAGSSCLGTADDPRYWAYYRAPAGSGGWQYSRAGAGATTVSDGDVEGWRFGTGGAPGFRAFCDVAGCAPPAPPPAEPASAPAEVLAGSPPGPGVEAGAPAGGDPSGVADPSAPGSTDGSGASPASGTEAGAPGDTATATRGSDRADDPGRTGRARGSGTRALGDRPVVGDDRGSGSPVGVLVALVLVGSIVVAGVALRRRGRRAPAD